MATTYDRRPAEALTREQAVRATTSVLTVLGGHIVFDGLSEAPKE